MSGGASMSEPELKPCPFCGGHAASGDWEDGGGDRWAGVCCTECLSEIQHPVDFHAITSESQIAEAIAAWNTRAPVDYAALPEVQALIAGAFEAARLAAFHGLHGCPVYTSPLIAVTTAIRAMTPADAIAARDAAIAEAVAKEREACAQAAHDAVTHPSAYACVAAIRKRKEN